LVYTRKGQGFAFHTKEFIRGYIAAMCKAGISSAPPGCHSPPDRTYIHQPGNGFDHHTAAFVDGYIKGWCSAANIGGHGAGGIEPNDDPESTLASFDCEKGLSSAYPHPKDLPN
jgi:hypothetical protein